MQRHYATVSRIRTITYKYSPTGIVECRSDARLVSSLNQCCCLIQYRDINIQNSTYNCLGDRGYKIFCHRSPTFGAPAPQALSLVGLRVSQVYNCILPEVGLRELRLCRELIAYCMSSEKSQYGTMNRIEQWWK